MNTRHQNTINLTINEDNDEVVVVVEMTNNNAQEGPDYDNDAHYRSHHK